MSGIVLDAGALIALDRNDRELWSVLKLAATSDVDVLVPSTALAQVWRGKPSQARLAQALQFCVIASFDALARSIGELCGRVGTSDVCDAHVALVAAEADVLYTSDLADMRRLLATFRRQPVVIRC